MMTTSNPLTLSLATAFGAYMLAASIGGWRDPARWLSILNEFRTNPALTFVTAAFTFALGVALILAHNDWSGTLASVVSAIGWIAAAKGLFLMVNPKPSLDLGEKMLQPRFLTPYLSLVSLIGAALLILGLTGTASP